MCTTWHCVTSQRTRIFVVPLRCPQISPDQKVSSVELCRGPEYKPELLRNCSLLSGETNWVSTLKFCGTQKRGTKVKPVTVGHLTVKCSGPADGVRLQGSETQPAQQLRRRSCRRSAANWGRRTNWHWLRDTQFLGCSKDSPHSRES
jgi:hypothetical protein